MELSPEDLSALKELIANQKTPSTEVAVTPQSTPALTVKLGGADYTARDNAELQRLIDNYHGQQATELESQRLQLETERQRLEAQAAAPPAKTPSAEGDTFDKEEYARLFMSDPRKAQHYMIQHDKDQLAFYSGMIGEITKLKQETAAAQFLLQNKDYEASPQNLKVMESIVGQFNLPWTIDGMNAAYGLALQTGAIRRSGDANAGTEVDEEGQDREAVITPPRMRGRRSTQAHDASADIVAQFENLSPEAQRKYLESLTNSR